MRKKNFLLSSLFISSLSFAQVGVGTTSPSSTLDITATNTTGTSTNVDGILIPRVDRQRAQSMTSIPNATLIYVESIATGAASGITSNITTTGFYYFDSSTNKWTKLETSGKNWSVDGNSGTTAGTNFLGTTDGQDLRFKTGGSDRLNISNTNGQIQSYYAGAAGTPAYSWNTDADTGLFSSSADNLDLSTGGTARFRIPNANQVHALSLGTAALPFYSFSADPNTGLFSSSADNLDLSTAGTARFRIPNANQVHALSLGTAALPFYSFSADPNTGLFSSSADNLDLSTAGTARFRIPNADQVHALSLGTAALPFYSFSTDTDTGIWSPTANNLAFSTASSERARIDANGHMGIGNTSPTHRLTVKHDSDGSGVVAIDNATSGGFAGIYFNQGAGVYRGHIGYVNTGGSSSFGGKGSFQLASGNRNMIFSTNSSSESFIERMIIAGDGRVGINTNPTNATTTIQPTSTLQIGGSIAVGITTINADTTLTDSHCKIIVNNGTTNITIVLPDPTTCSGRLLSFSRGSSSTGTITLDPTGTNNIQNLSGTVGNTTTVAGHSGSGAGINIQFWSNGSIWYR